MKPKIYTPLAIPALFRRLVYAVSVAAMVGCGATGPASIRHSEHLAIEGARLFLEIRGPDRRAPVFLWLHGGPGGSERPLFRYFNSDLEDHFLVAYWDQRGAGRSFDPKDDPRRLTIARHLADLDTVVDHLRQSFGQEKIVLIGHSWGAALGLLYAQAHPDKVSALFAVNPLVSTREQQQAQYDFVLSEALQRKDDEALGRLQTIGPPPHKTAAEQLDIERLAERYGGVFHNKPNYWWVTVAAIFSGLVTPWEIPSFIRPTTYRSRRCMKNFSG